jgi:lincosamide nucleotidyltransferase A/C/D/E
MARIAGPDREPHTDMAAEDVVDRVDSLEAAGIGVRLDGGWGVDALLGKQTRTHDDLGLVAPLDAVPRLQEALARRGYTVVGGRAPVSFEMTDDEGRQVDVHPVVFTTSGGAIYRVRSGEEWIYPAPASGASGTCSAAGSAA